MNLDYLFTFPIVMVDGENEERKERESNLLGAVGEEAEYDIIYGEASYPYFDFIGFEDRWLPTQRSLHRAIKQKFDACIVRFERAGQFLVPMTKEKFKEALHEFAISTRIPKGEMIIKIDSKKIDDFLTRRNEDTDTKGVD